MSIPMLFPGDTARARLNDPAPSHEAADTNDTAGSRVAVLGILRKVGRPLADHELEAIHRRVGTTQYTGQRLRTARAELVTRGLIEPNGSTTSPTGRRTTTWSIT